MPLCTVITFLFLVFGIVKSTVETSKKSPLKGKKSPLKAKKSPFKAKSPSKSGSQPQSMSLLNGFLSACTLNYCVFYH